MPGVVYGGGGVGTSPMGTPFHLGAFTPRGAKNLLPLELTHNAAARSVGLRGEAQQPRPPALCRRHASISPGHALQRLDRDLAEFDGARAVLQREMPLLEHAVAHVDGLLPVEHHDEMPAIGRDLESIPLAGGLGHRVDLGEIHDRAGAVARVGALVVDVDLVAGPGADGRGVLASNEDAAVGRLVRPELGVDLEVLVRALGDEVTALALVGDERSVLDAPIGLSRAGPVAHRLAVGQRDPARAGLADRLRRKLDGDETGREQPNGRRKRAYHDVVLPVSDWRAAERLRFFHFGSSRLPHPRHECVSATDASKRRGLEGRCRDASRRRRA
jgi:hypothetical protein